MINVPGWVPQIVNFIVGVLGLALHFISADKPSNPQ